MRTAPPGSSCASSTRTSQPRVGQQVAATRPFGPTPTTTASAADVARRGRCRFGAHATVRPPAWAEPPSRPSTRPFASGHGRSRSDHDRASTPDLGRLGRPTSVLSPFGVTGARPRRCRRARRGRAGAGCAGDPRPPPRNGPRPSAARPSVWSNRCPAWATGVDHRIQRLPTTVPSSRPSIGQHHRHGLGGTSASADHGPPVPLKPARPGHPVADAGRHGPRQGERHGTGQGAVAVRGSAACRARPRSPPPRPGRPARMAPLVSGADAPWSRSGQADQRRRSAASPRAFSTAVSRPPRLDHDYVHHVVDHLDARAHRRPGARFHAPYHPGTAARLAERRQDDHGATTAPRAAGRREVGQPSSRRSMTSSWWRASRRTSSTRPRSCGRQLDDQPRLFFVDEVATASSSVTSSTSAATATAAVAPPQDTVLLLRAVHGGDDAEAQRQPRPRWRGRCPTRTGRGTIRSMCGVSPGHHGQPCVAHRSFSFA